MAASTSGTAGKPDAFDGIAPSASTSAAMKQPPYDVFINHHGNDVKYTLATDIYRALDARGLRVFLDSEELELGDFFPSVLQQAIAGASLHIAIFSEHYAQSTWCLAELALMLQTGTQIIPIFYKVQPVDLRHVVHGKGIYMKAFAEHKKKGRYSLEKLEEWKTALKKVSFYTGDIIDKEDDEQRLVKNEKRVVKNVVNRVLKDMKKEPLYVAKHSVGLNEAVEEFERIAQQCHGNVQIVGLWGMGGSGKTTLAKEVYNKKCSSMQRCSFLFDIRDAAEKGLLHQKPKKLLENLNFHVPSFDHVDEGKVILASRLTSVSVLIVLDDVDHPRQLEALLPGKDNLENLEGGSLIIVTTRERKVLQSWGISAIYEMTGLNPSHAKHLFCWHAFLQPSPRSGFEQIVEKFLTACQGLPLSLEVLGGQLYGNSQMDYWAAQLEKISRVLPGDIKERLKISYDALDEEDQEMFLDTACFFIGEEISTAMTVWDGSGWNGLLGWESLVNKCLVDEPDKYNRIRMHDHLRDLGRDIANKKSPYRLWSKRQIIHIQPTEEICIRGLQSRRHDLDGFHPSSQGEIRVNTTKGFRNLNPFISGLKFFYGSGRFLNQTVSEGSRELVWVRCHKFEENNLPSWLSLESLRILRLDDARNLEILWEAEKDAPLQLRVLVLGHCRNLKDFPRSIGLLKHLKILKFFGLDGMTSLPKEICLLQSLQYLLLERCRSLSSLPRCFGNLTNLQHLILSGCIDLSSLPSSIGNLTNLQHLNLSVCINLSSLPSSIGNLTNLQHLNLSVCINLSSLPSSIGNLTNLQHLNLSVCKNLSSLPSSIGNLTNLQHLKFRKCSKLTIESENLDILENMTRLQYLDFSECGNMKDLPRPCIENGASLKELKLGGTRIREVPANICQLSKLEILRVGSDSLTSLPSSIGNLSSLTTLKIISCKLLTSLPTTLGNLCSLLKLEVMDCYKLECLPDSLGCLNKLEDLKIISSGVKTLPESFTRLVNLQSLQIESPISELSFGPGCKLKKIYLRYTKLSKISISEYCCPCLRTLEVRDNYGLMEVETLPTALEVLELVDCNMKMLKDIRSICGLVNLQTLKISNCADFNLILYVAELTSPKTFELRFYHKVEKIEGLEDLKSLEKLTIGDCRELGTLPNFAELISLREIEVEGCLKVQKIEGLQYLRSLEKLKVCGCPELDGLPGFAELSSLETFELRGCHKVEKIEGLEDLRSLKEFEAYTCLKVPCIIRLEKARDLRKVIVVANEKSVVEHCIPTIHQKWPDELIICTRAVSDVGSFVNSQAFPNLSVLDSFAMKKIGSVEQLKLRYNKRSSSSANAIIICIIINVASPVIDLDISAPYFRHGTKFRMNLGQGKWVWMSVFTQESAWYGRPYYRIFQEASDENNVVESAWLMTGEDESFRHLFHTFAR
ncbi:hypothetical protein KI387_033196 [Taxus chinensis]|uniref:TIR domain-containing protein n=1 Tax=Taxus chinensis TaxID=29808 RepID=A0AA38C119_TAXCH|nr:hypothetical protein KI387_033196 [Taxus chinensis]